ncbi:hypothetical protein CVU37_04920 [candidate division BRC1 bacterium HGW-BRC1-1]|nr:MAG: hypothetical protein CVU37_04920 [candidate division BRC1 bacterium HGW-BRC1-1]
MNATPGIGDPYWYEWSLGQEYIVDMLRPDTDIEGVTLQAASAAAGLDDVVVAYKDGRKLFIQVKHTRADNSLTFGDLVTPGTADSSKPSMLKGMANAWMKVANAGSRCDAILVTNRPFGTQRFTVKRDHAEITRPPLNSFWPDLKAQLSAAKHLDDLKFTQEWAPAWFDEFLTQLSDLPDDETRLRFLQCFDIHAGEPDLHGIETLLLSSLSSIFGISRTQASALLDTLNSHLKRWATTLRQRERIVVEDVCEAIKLRQEEWHGDHYLPPPEPFFASREEFCTRLVEALRCRTHPVFLVTGPPGCGKTSIISALADRVDPIIDFRFHAFKPITPETRSLPVDTGQTVAAEALWGDLLGQLRVYFHGRLGALRVPLRNDFLTVEQMRDHVLRLAIEVSRDRNRTVIIAIDGLDHAARARPEANNLFLQTLVPPEAVPAEICFVLAGQEPNAYHQYPEWLRNPIPNAVSVWSLPQVVQNDVADLISHSRHDIPDDQTEAVIRIITEYSDGNTLAAVFANAEAALSHSALELQKRLEHRNLKSGIASYYDSIWRAAVQPLVRLTFAEQRLASLIALAPERISGTKLAAVFQELLVPAHDWSIALRALQPLLIEEHGEFRVLHNDVRVYLHRHAMADRGTFVDVASCMADYYASAVADPAARHASLLSLLSISNRSEEHADVVTPAYIVEGAAIGRSMAELLEHCQMALRSAVCTREPAWSRLLNAACVTATVLQFRSSQIWQGLDHSAHEHRWTLPPPVLPAEAHIPSRDAWTTRILLSATGDALDLIHAGEHIRARGLLRRWFADVAPGGLGELLRSQRDESESPQVGDRVLSEHLEEALRFLGEVTLLAGVQLPRLSDLSVSDAGKASEAAFSTGQLRAFISGDSAAELPKMLKEMTFYFSEDLGPLLEHLAFKCNWQDLEALLEYEQPDRASTGFLARASLLCRFAPNPQTQTKWSPDVNAWPRLLDAVSQCDYSEQLETAAWLCAGMACANPTREPAAVRDDVLGAYYASPKDARERSHCGRIFHAASVLGRALAICRHRGAAKAQQLVSPADVGLSAHALLFPEESTPTSIPFHYHDVAKKLLAAADECAHRAAGDLSDALYAEYEKYARTQKCGSGMELCWRGLARRGEVQLLRKWAEVWIGESGKAWDCEIGDRAELVHRFASLCTEVGLTSLGDSARSRDQWGRIGYLGHKEYSLSVPLDWFGALAETTPESWSLYGVWLLALSREATELGDNRMGLEVEAAVGTATARAGVSAMWQLLNATGSQQSTDWVPFGDWMIVDALCGMVERMPVTEDDALAMWCFAVGFLNWQIPAERVPLGELRETLLRTAERNAWLALKTRMESLAPAEFSATCNRDRFRRPYREAFQESDTSKDESGMPLNEQIEQMCDEITRAIPGERSGTWSAMAVALQKCQTQRSEKTPTLVNRIRRILHAESERYSWSFDGRDRVYEALIPLMDERSRWEVARQFVETMEVSDPDRWLMTAIENLNTLCLSQARVSGIRDLEMGTERVLAMHTTWVEGAGRLKRLNRVRVGAEAGDAPTSWSEFFMEVLIRLLTFDESETVQTALRGMWLLGRINPEVFVRLARSSHGFDRRQRYRVLLIAERAAVEPQLFDRLRKFSEESAQSEFLEVALQASIVLRTAARVSRAELPAMSIGVYPSTGVSVGVGPGLLDIPAESRGIVTTGGSLRMARSLLQRIEAALGSIGDLEGRVAAIARTTPVTSHEPVRRHRHGPTILLRRSAAVEQTLDILSADLHDGRIRGDCLEMLAQAILSNDEPWLLLESPSPARTTETWPVDEGIEGLFGRSPGLVTDALRAQLFDGLPDGAMPVAGVVSSYSRVADYVLRYNHVLKSGMLLGCPPISSTIGGRTFALYDLERFEPSVQGYDKPFFFEAGGSGEFVFQQLDPFPALIWQNVFGWVPDPADPLQFLLGGQRVAWLERLHGPFRDEEREPSYRQPLLTRWVVKSDALNSAKEALGVYVKENHRFFRVPFSEK